MNLNYEPGTSGISSNDRFIRSVREYFFSLSRSYQFRTEASTARHCLQPSFLRHMSVQTRAKAPANRVYSSPAAQQQVRFRPRKQNVVFRRSLGVPQRSRQQTLTQIDFVNVQEAMDHDDDENEIYDVEGHTRKRKRRRTEGDAPSSTSKFHTQTLTQLEFVSTPASRLEDLVDEENDFRDASPDQNQAEGFGPAQNMGPPKTPSRRRVYEVPSSESPLSPASVRSQRSLPARSPLRVLDFNLQMSHSQRQDLGRSAKMKLETQDTFEYENESQQSWVPQTPKHHSSPTKNPKPATEPWLTLGTQKHFKDEIQDSDEEDEEDVDTYYDLGQESQLDQYILKPSSQFDSDAINPISSDTQEAEEQLQSTILQFTQQIPSTAQAQAHIRPSQATTVSLSQPPISSPIFSKRPRRHTPAGSGFTEDDEGLVTIPDSPSHQEASDLSQSPTLPRLPVDTQKETVSTSTREAQTEADVPLVPFSLPSSQILTRSQMLPESLMNDSVPVPPLLIEDSDFEE